MGIGQPSVLAGNWSGDNLSFFSLIKKSIFVAFGQTLHFARKMLKFPQRCLRADRRSMYAALDERKALQFELTNGMAVLNEAAKGFYFIII
jgi:hypothetical protein